MEDPELTNESCVIFESAHSTPMGECMTALPDFGDAICYYRYYRVPNELEPQERTAKGPNKLLMTFSRSSSSRAIELR